MPQLLRRFMLITLILGITSSCSQGPSPESMADLVQNKKQEECKTSSEKNQSFGPYGIDLNPSVMEFKEGELGEFRLEPWAKEGKSTVVEVENLPVGAVFDTTNNTLSWIPSYEAADDPNSPGRIEKIYEVKVKVTSPHWPNLQPVERPGFLRVTHTPQAFDAQILNKGGVLQNPPLFKVLVDEAHTHSLILEDADFPQGPFILETGKLPQGAVVSLTDDRAQYIFSWTPKNSSVDRKCQWKDHSFQSLN